MTPGESCDRHEQEIQRLRSAERELTVELSRKDAAIVALQRDQVALADRIPPNLREWMGKIDATLAGLSSNLKEVVVTLQQGYVTTVEFNVVRKQVNGCAKKEELEPIKSAFYKGIWLIVATIITAVLALVFSGKLQ